MDWNIVKYLNPEQTVFSKMDEQAKLQDALDGSRLDQAYKQMQMQQLQKKLEDDAAIRAEMEASVNGQQNSGDPYTDMLNLSNVYAKAALKRGDVTGILSLLNAADPLTREYRNAQIQNLRSLRDNRGEDKPEKKTVKIVNKDTGIQDIVTPSEASDRLTTGEWKVLQAEDPIDARINAALSGRGAGSAGKMQPQGNPNRVKIIRKLP